MLNRRGFLKLCAAVPVTAALPVPVFQLLDTASPLRPFDLGSVRAIAFYDASKERQLVRLDAWNGRQQFSIDFAFRLGGTVAETRETYLKALEPAEIELRNALIKEGWKASDLIPLPNPPLPRSVFEQPIPEWMH